MRIPKIITFLLVLFLLADTAYSFYQHHYLPHDGDMAPIIVPGYWYADVLADPFGFSILKEGRKYSGSNRFFAHGSLSLYFKTVPFLINKFTNMLDSTYLSSSIFRTSLQLLLIWLISNFITGTGKFWKPRFILAAALIAPLFQMGGYFERLTVIGNSITYTFFYAFSLAIVLLFFLPFYRAYVLKQGFHLNLVLKILLAGLVLVIPFQGPLNFGVAAIVVTSALLYFFWNAFKLTSGSFFSRLFSSFLRIPKPVLLYFSALLIVSLYSQYIGRFNSENDAAALLPLLDRYPKLLWGLNEQLFFGYGMDYGPAYSILFLTILINVVILYRKGGPEERKTINIIKWAGLISLIYILLLPLGGYRTYRPYIVEANTFLPVTLVIFFAFGLTSWTILMNLKFKAKKIYFSYLILVGLIFSSMERPNSITYDCEKAAFQKLLSSKEQFVNLDTWCGLMSWGSITDKSHSEIRVELMHYWGLLPDKEKRYITRQAD